MDEEHVKEASWVVQTVTGLSAYFYGIGYDMDTYMKELDAIVEHIEKSAET